MNILPAVLFFVLFPVLLTAAPFVEVTTSEDDAAGSLRQALIAVDEGGSLTFHSSLDGQIISLTSGHLHIDKAVTLDASGLNAGLTISGGNATGVFDLGGSADVVLHSITVADAFAAGGIVIAGGGKINLKNCAILNNHSEHSGGGIYIGEGAELEMSRCLIEGNSADRGGGIYNFGLMEIEACTFRNNEGREDGGGLYNRGVEVIGNCLFVGNTAREQGGAMWLRRDTYLVGCTILENSAEKGGGIYCSKKLNMEYCTIVRNSASNNYGGLYVAERIGIWGSIISDNEQVGTLTEITDILIRNSPNSFLEDGAPLDPLGDYSGPTQTLRPTAGASGLIDMGEPNPIITTDARGELRKYGEASDIGAVEFQGAIREELLELPGGDPDRDGVETLLEVAMGRDPLVSDFDSARRLKIDRVNVSAMITFGIDPDYADEIELTLSVTKGVEGLEIFLTNEEIRAIPLNDGIVEHDLILDARSKFYRLDAKFIPRP